MQFELLRSPLTMQILIHHKQNLFKFIYVKIIRR